MKRAGRAPAEATTQAAEPPTFHLDLAEIVDGQCFVVGWAVRKPAEESDLFVRRGERRIAPLVTFQRPDVIEYFTYTRSTAVDRFDIAYGFVLSFSAKTFDDLRLSVQGFEEALRAHPRSDDDDGSFLKRYLDAMQSLAASPALEAARARFQQLRMPRGRPASVTVEPVDADAHISVQSLLASCEAAGPMFEAGAAALDGRLALLAVHQRSRHLTHSHRAMIAALAVRGYRTLLVNSNPESAAGRDALADGGIAGLVRRPDHGRDVASWLLALGLLEGRLGAVEHVLFCNDSFLGPFDDLAHVLAHRAQANADFWALTDSWDRGYHLQSSFFTLSARCLRGEAFRHFVSTYAYPNQREAVVTQGELGLSRRLVDDGGVSMAVLAPYAQLAGQTLDEAPALLDALRALPEYVDALPAEIGYFARPQRGYVDSSTAWMLKFFADLRNGVGRNPQHVFWEALLTRHRVPFVKKELLFSNPAAVPGYHRILPVIAATYGAASAAWVEEDMRRGGMRAPAG